VRDGRGEAEVQLVPVLVGGEERQAELDADLRYLRVDGRQLGGGAASRAGNETSHRGGRNRGRGSLAKSRDHLSFLRVEHLRLLSPPGPCSTSGPGREAR